jgi:phenylpropionate dioxygenase-like ring-hydroxylating dioxygenase large terminal subunit
VFRGPDGRAACLSAVCCHRGGDLSRGRVKGACVQCPYHGWEFDADGRCTRMPPLGDDVVPPRRARVDAYPVQERYGYVWVFLGDLPEEERPALPDFLSCYGDTGNWRMVRLKRDWQANWARIHENLLDTSHLFLVHSFGRHLPARMKVWPTEKTAWGGRVVQRFPSKPNAASTTAVNRAKSAETRPESVVTLEFSIIGLMHKNTQQMTSGYDQVIWNCLTPVDAGHTRNFGLQFRNFQKEPQHDEAMVKAIRYGLEEDAAVVEHLRPRLAPATPAGELWMATDEMERLYRDQATAFRRRLGDIDVRRLAELSQDRVLVIPSPARRADPAGWLHGTVPLVTGEPGDASAIGGMGI